MPPVRLERTTCGLQARRSANKGPHIPADGEGSMSTRYGFRNKQRVQFTSVRHRTGSVGILLGVDRLRPADDENGPTSTNWEVGPFCAPLQRAGRTLRGRTLSYLLPPKNKRPGHMRIYIYMKMTKNTYLDLRVCESHSLAHVLHRTFVLPRMSYGSFVGTLQRNGAIRPETALGVVGPRRLSRFHRQRREPHQGHVQRRPPHRGGASQ